MADAAEEAALELLHPLRHPHVLLLSPSESLLVDARVRLPA